MSSAFSAAKPVTRQLSFAVKQRMAIPIDRTEVPNVFKYSDGKRYRIVAAAIVERPPVIVPDLPKWLTDYHEFKFTRDNQLARNKGEPILDEAQKLAGAKGGKKNDASGQHKVKGANAGGKGPNNNANNNNKNANSNNNNAAGIPVDPASVDDTAFDPTIEDMFLFRPASRTTAADEANDVRSTQRALGSSLFLTVKKARDQFAWAFPQGGYEPEKDGEHLRNAAARELAEECGANLRVFFYGHSPVFHIDYLYDDNAPARAHHKADGAKVFFYPAIYLGGDVELDKKELEDYQWMKLEEVVARLAPPVAKLSKQVFFDPYIHTAGTLDTIVNEANKKN
jgi:large subunit ribosomal protein L46